MQVHEDENKDYAYVICIHISKLGEGLNHPAA